MKLIQFEALFFRDFSTDVWPFPLHNHNHYEIMFIEKGRGIHILNGVSSPYCGENVLFLLPEDKHDFIIEEETHFRVIKFLPTILKGGINASSNDFWTNLLYSVARKIQSRCGLPPETAYTAKLKSIVFIMIAEWKDSGELISELHANLMRSLLLMLNKCFEDSIDRDISIFGDSKIERIQNYLHTYIYYPEKLKVKQLSISFNMSQSSIRIIFSEQMGMSLRAYIGSLKIQLIKERIINSSDSLSQISRDFGFTDSSHLHRFFLSHTGSAPMKFRKKINS